MKVIIQEVESKKYLSGNGQWVKSAAVAEDFETILQAYTFAKTYTSGCFRVVLYSAEDNYTANIVEGVGVENLEAATMASAPEVSATAVVPTVRRNVNRRNRPVVYIAPRYYDLRNYRN